MATNGTTFSTSSLKVFFQSKRAGLEAQLVSRLVEFIDATTKSLDCAIYDLRHPDVLAALRRVVTGGKKLRIAFDGAQKKTEQDLKNFKLLGQSTPVHPTGNHLMHNKYLVRDGKSVWTGSANFTPGGLELQDNNCLIIKSASLAKQYATEFNQLITPQSFVTAPSPSKTVNVGSVKITPFFAPGASEGIEDKVVEVLQGAQRVRVMAFLISDPGILNALTAFREPGFDILGVLDPHGMKDALGHKTPDPLLFWFLNDPRFVNAPSHAFNPNGEQDFMHNKLMIIDDRLVVTGSYNFSENAEANDENLVLIESQAVAAAYTAYFDALFTTYS